MFSWSVLVDDALPANGRGRWLLLQAVALSFRGEAALLMAAQLLMVNGLLPPRDAAEWAADAAVVSVATAYR